MVEKHSCFRYCEILSQPHKRTHRQSLAKLLCGDMMIGRITQHWFCRKLRVPGLPTGCIDCYREKGIKVIECEEHLIFDCVTTREMRVWFWKNIPETDARRCWSRAHANRLEALIATKNLQTWALLGEEAPNI